MKRSKMKYILCLSCILLAALTIWRLYPLSLSDVISTDENTIVSLACTAGIATVDADGTACIEEYTIQSLSASDTRFREILDLLKTSAYQQDFRNLLPCKITEVSSDHRYDGKTVHIVLTWGSSPSKNGSLYFTGSGVTISSGNNDELLLFHPTAPDILNTLSDYIRANSK